MDIEAQTKTWYHKVDTAEDAYRKTIQKKEEAASIMR